MPSSSADRRPAPGRGRRWRALRFLTARRSLGRVVAQSRLTPPRPLTIAVVVACTVVPLSMALPPVVSVYPAGILPPGGTPKLDAVGTPSE
jgi:hypothetical protein